jgi:osmotically-inducible protein OsmY
MELYKTNFMRADDDILNDIRTELQWDDRLDGANVTTEVAHGHVLLTGNVNSYPKLVYVEEAVRRIQGVRTVTNQLRVTIPRENKRNDKDIERSVKDIIKWNSSIDENKMTVNVVDAWVTLEGEADWEYQRSKARLLTQDVVGVRGITNLIKVRSDSAAA